MRILPNRYLLLILTIAFSFAVTLNSATAEQLDQKPQDKLAAAKEKKAKAKEKKELSAEARAPKAKKEFESKDKDGDGKLSLAEFVGERQGDQKDKATTNFQNKDKDGDGFLSVEESQARAPGKKKTGKQAKAAGQAAAGGDGGFYGIMPSGDRVAFVIDNSNSMQTRHRFDAAAAELVEAMSYIPYDKHFFVILFSDTAYPVFHPRGAKHWLKGMEENKKAVAAWLDTVELCLRTDAERSMEIAFAMKADEIFILTDGAFTDNTTKRLLDANMPGVTIHTIGLEVVNKPGKSAAKDLQAIAKKFGGQYRAMKLDNKTIAKFGDRVRATHKTPGPVWGLNLGKSKQKKKSR